MHHEKLTALFAVATLAATAGIAQARDLGPDEALKLRDAGTIQSFEKLNAAAIAKHPGSTVNGPSWKRNTAATSTRSNCVIPRACSGTWSWTPPMARYSGSPGRLMRLIMRYSGILALVLAVFALEAVARDLDQDEALKLREEGVIMPLEQLLHRAWGCTRGSPAGGGAGRGRRCLCLRSRTADHRRRGAGAGTGRPRRAHPEGRGG